MIPKAGCDAKIGCFVEMMMKRMSAPEVEGIAGRTGGPMMKKMMNRNIPEVSAHKPAGDRTCQKEIQNEKGGQKDKNAERRNADPGWCSVQRIFLLVMTMMHLPKYRKPVESETMKKIFEQCPKRSRRQIRYPPDHKPINILGVRSHDSESNQQDWIREKIKEISKLAEWHTETSKCTFEGSSVYRNVAPKSGFQFAASPRPFTGDLNASTERQCGNAAMRL